MSRYLITTNEFNVLNAIRTTLCDARATGDLDATRLRLVNAVIDSSNHLMGCVLLDTHLSVDENGDPIAADLDEVLEDIPDPSSIEGGDSGAGNIRGWTSSFSGVGPPL